MLQVGWNGLINHYPSHPRFCLSLCFTFRSCLCCIISKFRWKLLRTKVRTSCRIQFLLPLKIVIKMYQGKRKETLPYITSKYTCSHPAFKGISFNCLGRMEDILWTITKMLWAPSKDINEEGRSAANSSAMPHLGLELSCAGGASSVPLASMAVLSPQWETEEASIPMPMPFSSGHSSPWAQPWHDECSCLLPGANQRRLHSQIQSCLRNQNLEHHVLAVQINILS